MDCFLDPGDATTWISVRDLRVTRPYTQVARMSANGVPYQAPEVVLYMKAKHTRPKDIGDFERTLQTLDPAGKAWLAQALETSHPAHPWIEQIRDSA